MSRRKNAKTLPGTKKNGTNLMDLMQSCAWHELGIWPTDKLFAALSLCKSMRDMTMQSLKFQNFWSLNLRLNLLDSTHSDPSKFKFYALSLPRTCNLTIGKYNTRSQTGKLCAILTHIEDHVADYPGPSGLVIEDRLPPNMKNMLKNFSRLESLEFDMSTCDHTLENWLMHINAKTLRRIQTNQCTTFTLQRRSGIDIKRLGMLENLEELKISNMRLKSWRDSVALSALFGKIKCLTSLKRLDLSGNSLTCNNLLNLSQVRQMMCLSMSKLANLTKLSLRNCDLRTTAFLSHCTRLEELDLGENSRLDFEDFLTMDDTVNAVNCEKKTLMRSFSGLQSLKRLSLDKCRMSAHSLYIITHCMVVRGISIEFIDFSHNKGLLNDDKNHFWLAVIVLDLIQKLKSIKEAYLDAIEDNFGRATKNLHLLGKFRCQTGLRVLSLVGNGFDLEETKEAARKIFDPRVKVFI